MSKNTESLVEILSDENEKLEKLISLQNQSISRYEEILKTASNSEISTKRLEEVIEHWNELFNKQKKQMKEMQGERQQIFKSQQNENRIHRIVTYMLLVIIVLMLGFKNI